MDSNQVKFYTHDSKGTLIEVRRQRLEPAVLGSWTEMCKLMSLLLKVDFPGFSVQYVDNEGDKVIVMTAAEWEECIRLYSHVCESRKGQGAEQEPLRLHLRKLSDKKSSGSDKTKERHGSSKCVTTAERGTHGHSKLTRNSEVPPVIEPSHFYVSGSSTFPEATRLQAIQTSVIGLLQEYLPTDWADTQRVEALPVWLQSAVNVVCCEESADLKADFDVNKLERCLTKRAIDIMSETPAEALKLLTIASTIAPSADNTYNRACCMSLQGDVTGAMQLLRAAVEEGYHDVAHMVEDEDLQALYDEPTFQQLLSGLKPESKTETNSTQRSRSSGCFENSEVIEGAILNRSNATTLQKNSTCSVSASTDPATSASFAWLGCSQPTVPELQMSSSVITPLSEQLPVVVPRLNIPTTVAAAVPSPTCLMSESSIFSNTTSTVLSATTTVTATAATAASTSELTTTPIPARETVTTVTPSAAASHSQRTTTVTVPARAPGPSALPSRMLQHVQDLASRCHVAAVERPVNNSSFPYLKECQRLEEMGFTNDRLNRELLLDTRGNLPLVLERLLQQP